MIALIDVGKSMKINEYSTIYDDIVKIIKVMMIKKLIQNQEAMFSRNE